MNTPLPDIEKIAVLRANALGDFVFTLPALQALREAYPNAEIVLLGKAWHKEYLDSRPGPVDRVEVVPKSKGINGDEHTTDDVAALQHFYQQMRKEKFDIAVQLHGGGKHSNRFITNLGARLTVGLQTPDAESLDISVPYVYYHNEILRYLEVVAKIGAHTDTLTPHLAETKKDVLEVAPYLTEKPYIVIHPGATDIRRRWSPQKFARIADKLYQKGYEIMLTGQEESIVSRVQQLMHYPSHNLANKLTLHGLTGLLTFATAVIANDTGPLHVARALNTPTVGIFWCANVINGGSLSTEFHRSAISWMIHCPLCGTNCAEGYPWDDKSLCEHVTSFVSSVTVADVEHEVFSLLKSLSREAKRVTQKDHRYNKSTASPEL